MIFIKFKVACVHYPYLRYMKTDRAEQIIHGKSYKISNTFLSNKLIVFRAGIHKMLVRIDNREDPDQTASQEAV